MKQIIIHIHKIDDIFLRNSRLKNNKFENECAEILKSSTKTQ